MNPWSMKKCEELLITVKTEASGERFHLWQIEHLHRSQNHWKTEHCCQLTQIGIQISSRGTQKHHSWMLQSFFHEDVNKAVSCFRFLFHWPDMAKLELPPLYCRLTMGWHLTMAPLENDWRMGHFCELLSWEGVCALREVGLDYFRCPVKGWQKEVFSKMVDLVMEFTLLLMLHLWDHDNDASAALDALDILWTKLQMDHQLYLYSYNYGKEVPLKVPLSFPKTIIGSPLLMKCLHPEIYEVSHFGVARQPARPERASLFCLHHTSGVLSGCARLMGFCRSQPYFGNTLILGALVGPRHVYMAQDGSQGHRMGAIVINSKIFGSTAGTVSFCSDHGHLVSALYFSSCSHPDQLHILKRKIITRTTQV